MKNVIKIILAITVVVGMFNCGQMNINPTDEEIAFCNENPDSCNIGDEIVMDGAALTKDTNGVHAPASLFKDISGVHAVILVK